MSETKMNKSSSRSHCLFSITVHTAEEHGESIFLFLIFFLFLQLFFIVLIFQHTYIDGTDGGRVDRTGRLHLCDLAGSECAKTAGSDAGGMDRERKNINQSLLTLGRVITSLQDTSKKNRVPYRDSKLVIGHVYHT